MASNNTRRAARNTTNIVVRNGPAANQGAAAPNRGQNKRRNMLRRARRQQRAQVTVRVQPNQNPRRGRVPRRPRLNNRVVFQKITTTLGTVGSNGSGQIECELTCLMNPATMKEATGSNSYGPLGIYASTYSLFRMTKCIVRLKPLVGDSAVSGTVCRISWNPTSSPTQTSWSALGARKHSDVTPGKTGTFVLTTRDLVGPKGGWYKTNTKGDPMMSFAGTLEIHTLGQTMSTYQNGAFTGGLFLAEMETEWQFKDYAQQPGMLNLLKGEDTQQAQVQTDANGKVQLVLPETSRMARAATTSASEIIWLVTDTLIQAGTAAFPPPFGWLFRGGWWLLKRAVGAPVRAGEVRFDVYASISDARADMPCISSTPNSNAVAVGGLHFQQITPGNTGIGDDIPRMVREIPSETPDSNTYVLSFDGMYDETYTPGDHILYEKSNVPRSERGLALPVQEGYITTYNYGKVVVTNREVPTEGIPVYLAESASSRTQVGLAVAGTSVTRTVNNNNVTLSTLLFYGTTSRGYNFTNSNDGNFRVGNLSYNLAQAQLTLQARTVTKRRIQVDSGSWYIMQFFCYGASYQEFRVDIGGELVIRTPNAAWPTPDTTVSYIPTATDAAAGLAPGYSTSIQLSDIQSYTVTRYARALMDEDVYHDLPPLEDDGDDDADDFSDEQLELEPGDGYGDPPRRFLEIKGSRACKLYQDLLDFGEDPKAAARAVNQLYPCEKYTRFCEVYHDMLVDGNSPPTARACALEV
nr:capsid protein [Astrovirus sp.]